MGIDIEAAFRAACGAELQALKPGNVHRYADGHGMTIADFTRSAEASAPAIAHPSAPLGLRILDAVTATRAAVGQNTNLGIILLCAPLAMAMAMAKGGGASLRAALADVLAAATIADTENLYRAIAIANPAGLGTAPEGDVHAPPRHTPVEAMRLAAGRDSIAGLYASDFALLFDDALPALRAAAAYREIHWAIAETYLLWLAIRPDSHIARKHGTALAIAVQHEARAMYRDFRENGPCIGRLMDWDRSLKQRRLNPGTAADLTVATYFAFLSG